MNTKSNRTTAGTNSAPSGAALPGHGSAEPQPLAAPDRSGASTGGPGAATGEQPAVPEDAVARRTPTGWRVGDEEVPDLTSAMVLADLLAADLPSEEEWQAPAGGLTGTASQEAASQHVAGVIAPGAGTHGPRSRSADADPAASPGVGKRAAGKRRVSKQGGQQGLGAYGAELPAGEAEQLKETVAQLERALTVRVRVEQAIGVLAERHRLRPRQAFELLRSASRARGARVSQTAGEVVASATNPLLRIPEELARQPEGRRASRRTRRNP